MSQQTQEAVNAANASAEAAKPATTATETETAGTKATASSTETEEGRGSKDAILADLATERDRRQAAETRAEAVLKAVQEALGIKSEMDDPKDLKAQLQSKDAETVAAKLQLAIYRSPAAKTADVDSLLDSLAFQKAVAKVDPGNPAAVEQAIQAFITSNPRFKAVEAPTTVVPASKDLTQGNGSAPTGKTMDQMLRGQ